MGMLFPGLEPGPARGRAARAPGRGARLPARGRQPAAVRRLLPRPPVHPRARRRRRAVRPSGCSPPSWPRASASRSSRPGRQAERDLAAEAIYRFVFGSLYRLHAFNGDPHPGNYLFRPGGQVTFLDFGLVKRFEPATRSRVLESMIQAMVLDHDIPALPPDPRRASGCSRTTAAFTDDADRGLLRPLLRLRPAATRSPRSPRSTRRRRCAGSSTPAGPTATIMKAANVPPVVRDHPAHQPRPLRDPRPAPRHGELAPHRRGALADRRRPAHHRPGPRAAAWAAAHVDDGRPRR